MSTDALSPNDRTGEVSEEIEAWLAAGCAAVWVVDPKLETVTIYRSRMNVVVKTANGVIEGEPVVPALGARWQSCSEPASVH